MKNSILIIATVVLSTLNMNATNEKTVLNPLSEITENSIAQIFEWEVKTNKGKYAGTALSLDEAQHLIAISSRGEMVKNKKITSYFILKSAINNKASRNYFWEVQTKSGKAKGYSSSEAHAHKMIALVASGDVIIDKIIISQPQQ